MNALRILEDFYRGIMASYPPQGETLLARVRPEAWRQLAFRYTLSVEAMTQISHIIEEQAMQHPRPVCFHVSFQTLSRFLPQRERYRALAPRVKRLWLYGAFDVADPEEARVGPNVILIDTEGTLLLSYWFVIAYGPGLSMCLLAREIPALDGRGRFYEGFYTFEPAVAYEILTMLHLAFPSQVPAPARVEEL
ncbi:DICT sensory domain-containing protein [Thermoflexus hugenholtzii]